MGKNEVIWLILANNVKDLVREALTDMISYLMFIFPPFFHRVNTSVSFNDIFGQFT